MRALSSILAFVLLSSTNLSAEMVTIQGVVESHPAVDAPIYVWSMPTQPLDTGGVARPTKQAVFAAASNPGGVTADPSGKFRLQAPAGGQCLFAFADLNNNGRWDPGAPEPFGWHTDQIAGHWAEIQAKQSVKAIDIQLTAPTPFAKDTLTTPGGALRWIKGYPVLQLHGDAKQRGHAHGKLLAPQIVDFFRFYVLEDKFGSAERYESGFAKFLHSNFAYPKAYVTECTAVIEGMKESGANIYVPELEREFSLTDLYAINAYIETRAMRTSCTQFAAWGERTDGTDVSGGMITGRNMDGEIDLRKVTVSHFVLFAVDPTEPGQKRFVSMMWPGFVATISGINEEGFYTMENAGLTGPGGVVRDMVPFSWAMRESLAKLGANATHDDVQRLVDSFDNSAGGSCGPGCITLFATPYSGQQSPAYILEGDRFGDRVRLASEVAPHVPGAIMASNHHRKYGYSPSRPGKVFDKTPSFSSLWRYESGMHKMESWYRTGRNIGTPEMRDLLQTVAHGTTEYAIITRPNKLEIDVAVASMKAEPWDAPYREWTTYRFEELFSPAK